MALRINQDTRAPSMTDVITVDGSPFDLTGSTVKLQMRAVNSSTLKVDTAAVVTDDAGGAVRYDWLAADVDTAGDYLAWWQVTLPGGKLQEGREFAVEVFSHARAGLVEVEDVREYIGKPFDDVGQDTLINGFVDSATTAIQNYTGRRFIVDASPATKTFDVLPWDVTNRMIILNDDLSTTPTEVKTVDAAGDDVTTFAIADDLIAYPLNRESWEPIGSFRIRDAADNVAVRYQVSVTGTWGFPSVPPDVANACLQQVRTWWRRDVANTGTDDVYAPEAPSLERPQSLANEVRRALWHYRRPGVA